MLEEEEGISQTPLRVSQVHRIWHSHGQPGCLLPLQKQGHHRQCWRNDGPQYPHPASPTVQVLPLAFHPALLPLPSVPALAPGLGPAKSIHFPYVALCPVTTVTRKGHRPQKGFPGHSPYRLPGPLCTPLPSPLSLSPHPPWHFHSAETESALLSWRHVLLQRKVGSCRPHCKSNTGLSLPPHSCPP